jgi:hypothetical protein
VAILCYGPPNALILKQIPGCWAEVIIVLASFFPKHNPGQAELSGYCPADLIAAAIRRERRSRSKPKTIKAKAITTYLMRICKELARPTPEDQLLPPIIKRVRNRGARLLEAIEIIYADWGIDLNLPADDGDGAPPPVSDGPGAKPNP